jgi:hypothetical protein
MYQSLNKRKILAVCVAASLLSHVISLVFLQKHAFWRPSFLSDPRNAPLASIVKARADQILKESFQEIAAAEEEPQDAHPHLADIPVSPLSLLIPSIQAPIEPAPIPEISIKPELVAQSLKPSFVLPPLEPLNLFDHLPKDLLTLQPKQSPPTHPSIPTLLPKRSLAFIPSPPLPTTAKPEIVYHHAIPNCSQLLLSARFPNSCRSQHLFFF